MSEMSQEGIVRVTEKRVGSTLPGFHFRAGRMGALKALQALRTPRPSKSLACET
jgi:hypothetical protein